MDELKFNIKGGFGKHNELDKAYNRLIQSHLNSCDDNEKERWVTYSSVIDEIIDLKQMNSFRELKYRITDGENINKVLISIINDNSELKTELKKYLRTLQLYDDVDFMKRYI